MQFIKPRLRLERATRDNALLQALEDAWAKEVERYEGDADGYAIPHMEHARRIVADGFQKYGIYVLHDESGGFVGLMHVNSARLPKTTGVTLRVNWILLSPSHDYEDVSEEDLAHISASILFGALNLARSELPADHIKVRLNNMGDKQFARGIAYALHEQGSPTDVAVRGNWLHIDNIG